MEIGWRDYVGNKQTSELSHFVVVQRKSSIKKKKGRHVLAVDLNLKIIRLYSCLRGCLKTSKLRHRYFELSLYVHKKNQTSSNKPLLNLDGKVVLI